MVGTEMAEAREFSTPARTGLTAKEEKFIQWKLKGFSHEEAAEKAGLVAKDGRRLLFRPLVMDALLGHYARLGVKWQSLATEAKECLSDIITLKVGTAGEKASPAIRVQACKVVVTALININPHLLSDEVEEMSKDVAAAEILGKLGPSGKAN